MVNDTIIIGGGPAGLKAASSLNSLGHKVTIIEKTEVLGGQIKNWYKLFPDFSDSYSVVSNLTNLSSDISINLNSTVLDVQKENGHFNLLLSNNKRLKGKSILLTTGFSLYDASKKEEYGYGFYKGVLTNKDLEHNFINNPKFIDIDNPTVVFIHCVGSRDHKAGNMHCSKVCCVTAVKQAIEIKQFYPKANVYCFYMDLRMFGRGYEDLYLKAQSEYNIKFIRGRVSEISETFENKIVVKAEDTLSSKPIKLTSDYAILMSGIVPTKENFSLFDKLSVSINSSDGFSNEPSFNNLLNSKTEGVFTAGCINGPKTIPEVLTESDSVALSIHSFLRK